MPGPEPQPTIRVRSSFPNDDPVFTATAVAGLVGQDPMFLRVPGDYESAVGRAVIVAAEIEGDDVILTLDVPQYVAVLLEPYTRQAEPLSFSIGWSGNMKHSHLSSVSDGKTVAPSRRVVDEFRMYEAWAAFEPALRLEEDPEAAMRATLTDLRTEADALQGAPYLLPVSQASKACTHPRRLIPQADGSISVGTCSSCSFEALESGVPLFPESEETQMRAAIREALEEAYQEGDNWASFVHYPGPDQAAPPARDEVVGVLLAGLGFGPTS